MLYLGDVSSSAEQKGPLENTGQIVPHQQLVKDIVTQLIPSVVEAQSASSADLVSGHNDQASEKGLLQGKA